MKIDKTTSNILTLIILFFAFGIQNYSAQKKASKGKEIIAPEVKERKAPKGKEDSTYFMIMDIKNILVGAKLDTQSNYMLRSEHNNIVNTMLSDQQNLEAKNEKLRQDKDDLNGIIDDKESTISDKEEIIAGKKDEINDLKKQKKDIKEDLNKTKDEIEILKSKKQSQQQEAIQIFSKLSNQTIRDNSASIETLKQLIAFGGLIGASTDKLASYLDIKILLDNGEKMFKVKYDEAKTQSILQKIDAIKVDKNLFADILEDAELLTGNINEYKKYTCDLKNDIQTILDDGLSEITTKNELDEIYFLQSEKYPYLEDMAEKAVDTLTNTLADFSCD